MPNLISSPWTASFDRLISGATSSLTLCSPFIGYGPCKRIRKQLKQETAKSDLQLSILTDLSRDKMMTGATDVTALSYLVRELPNTTIRILPSLHAKIYVADDRHAVVTSGNLTDNGLMRNFEYGVEFTDTKTVRSIKSDVVQYASLGSPIDRQQLEEFVEVVDDLQELRAAADRSEPSHWREEFDKRLEEAQYAVLRARTDGRSRNAIFSDAILHVLRDGPLTTIEINPRVQQIHPDLCDDNIDLYIKGEQYGKKWKHGVRNAQASLKQKSKIEKVGNKWRLKD